MSGVSGLWEAQSRNIGRDGVLNLGGWCVWHCSDVLWNSGLKLLRALGAHADQSRVAVRCPFYRCIEDADM